MPAPQYMRFFPDAYLDDTEHLSMEEQGIYMRLLCRMWKGGAKIRKDDLVIAKAVGVHMNKWLKVKPRIIEFLIEHSPGYYTQKRLRREYRFAVGKSKTSNSTTPDTSQDTLQVTMDVTPIVTTLVTPGVENGKNEENQRSGSKNSPDALDESKSREKDKNRLLDDDGEPAARGKAGEWLATEKADAFLNALLGAFRACNLTPPTDYDVVRGWIDNGLEPFRDILPIIQEILQRVVKGAHAPPQSWKYFAKEVYQKSSKRRK